MGVKEKNKLFVSGKDSIKIFDNSFLEWITTTHHIVPFLIFIPVIAYFIWETVVFLLSGLIENT